MAEPLSLSLFVIPSLSLIATIRHHPIIHLIWNGERDGQEREGGKGNEQIE